MFNLRIRKGWEILERYATPERIYTNRRTFLSMMGIAALSYEILEGSSAVQSSPYDPAARNPRYALDRPITGELAATRYNNFREFSDQKETVWRMVDQFQTKSWSLQVGGLVQKPQTFDLDQLIRQMPLEERLYRHRCIEGWAMAVPWTGFPFKSLLDQVPPTADARYVLMTSFYRPNQAEGQRLHKQYQWPMRAAITLPEAMNEQQEQFDLARMETRLRRLPASTRAAEIVKMLLAEVTRFSGAVKPHDDMTLVVVRVT